jgi:DNA polymerase-1
VTGRIHTQWNQLGTVTGRFSSDSPNLQNIPKLKEYRAAFIAKPGFKYIIVDYSQQEYRLVGAITGDEVIINSYLSGKDMHTSTAAIVNHCTLDEVTKEQRSVAKNINFATLYLSSAWGLAYKFQIPNEEAEALILSLKNGYPRMSAYRDAYADKVYELGKARTLLGRTRFFKRKPIYADYREMDQEKAATRREGYNTLIQGTAADMGKIAMCDLFYNNPFGHENFHLVLAAHDELVAEVREDLVEEAEKFMTEVMCKAEQPFLGVIPAEVEVKRGDFWVK